MFKTPLSVLPSTPKLLTHALDGTLPFKTGFPISIDVHQWEKLSLEERSTNMGVRQKVAEVLMKQAKKFSVPEKVLDNIKVLAEPGTLAVVTGQQPGMMGGPLLTLYKTITAIHLAKKMEKESGVRTIPIFWMASSDHNLSEVTQLHWINVKGKLTGYKSSHEVNRVPVGKLKLNSYSEEVLTLLEADMPDTEFKEKLLEYLKLSYTSEATFSSSFQQLAFNLFSDYGLIVLDPEDSELKALTIPFWENTIDHIETLQEELIAQSEVIRSNGYDLQVPVEKGRPAMFLLEDNTRRKIVLDGYKIRARSDVILSKDELMDYAKNKPEMLSAGVTLRPLLQSYFLPTGAYIAGPHEMAYWMQLDSSFESFGYQKPAIIPRASFTLIEKKLRRKITKYDIDYEDILKGESYLTNLFLNENNDEEMDRIFNEMKSYMQEKETELLKKCSKNLYNGMESKVDVGFRKINYQLDKLEGSFINRLKITHSDMLKDVEKITTHLLPAGKPQERVISPFYYFIRYGTGIIDGLLKYSDDAIGNHVFLDMEELI